MRISASVEHGEEENKDIGEKEQGKERAKREDSRKPEAAAVRKTRKHISFVHKTEIAD